MEHEGPHVGKCKVPLGLLAQLNMAEGGFVVVEMSRKLRVERLVLDYCGNSNGADDANAGGSWRAAGLAAAAVATGVAAVGMRGGGGVSRMLMGGGGAMPCLGAGLVGALALRGGVCAGGGVATDRAARLRQQQQRQVDAELEACVENLRRKLGEPRYLQAVKWLAVRDYSALAELMLDYYDGLYDSHRQSNTSNQRAVVRFLRPSFLLPSATASHRDLVLPISDLAPVMCALCSDDG
jgi:hypothetical protein